MSCSHLGPIAFYSWLGFAGLQSRELNNSSFYLLERRSGKCSDSKKGKYGSKVLRPGLLKVVSEFSKIYCKFSEVIVLI